MKYKTVKRKWKCRNTQHYIEDATKKISKDINGKFQRNTSQHKKSIKSLLEVFSAHKKDHSSLFYLFHLYFICEGFLRRKMV